MERLQPVDQGAEESTLGAMMLSTEACGTAVELLKPEDFWLEQHRTIFAAISHLYDNGKPTDSFSVASFLKAKGLLEAVGERAYVYTITDSCPTPHNVTHYAGIVRDHSVRRKLIEAGNKVMNLGYSTQDELEKQLDSAETEVYSVGERLRRASLCHVSKAIDLSLERMYEARERGSRVTGLRTGFNELDSYLAGLQPSNLIVIGGRTSMGKTSLALNIAQHVALHEDTGVLLFSMEMSKKELGDRLIQSQAHVDSSDFRAGRLSDIQVNSVEEAGERISKAKIYIDDEGDRSLAEIRSISRRAVAKGKVGLLVVDYIQLLYGDGRTENRAQEMSKIARSLKVMAMQLGVPVIAVSQLRRPPPGGSAQRAHTGGPQRDLVNRAGRRRSAVALPPRSRQSAQPRTAGCGSRAGGETPQWPHRPGPTRMGAVLFQLLRPGERAGGHGMNGLVIVPLVLLAAIGLASALGSHMRARELEVRLDRAREEAGFWQQLATDLDEARERRGW